MKTIFHIDSNDKWSLALSNVKNLKKEDDAIKIIVLANSNAVKGYLNNNVINEVKELSSDNITFKACNNALNKFNIDKSLIDDKVEIVSAGVYELTLKQTEGYSYIKV